MEISFLDPNAAQVIIACSSTKRRDPLPIAAFVRYTGPAWHTYRAHKSCAQLPGFALSAEHGLISEYEPILDYDRRLDRPGQRRLAGQVAAALHKAERHGQLVPRPFMFGGAIYRELFAYAWQQAKLDPSRPIYSGGAIGVQLGQLKAYLEESNNAD